MGLTFGLALLLGALVGGFYMTKFSLFFIDGVSTKSVEPDGEVNLRSGTWVIREPAPPLAEQVTVTDESGQRLEVKTALLPLAAEGEEPATTFGLEEATTVRFDSDGQPIELRRPPSEWAAVMFIALVIGWVVVGGIGLAGFILALIGLVKGRR